MEEQMSGANVMACGPPVDALVVLGSETDAEKANIMLAVMKKLGLTYRVDILSCHRNIDEFGAFVDSINAKVVVYVGGMAFAAPGILEACLVKTDRLGFVPFAVPLDVAARSAIEDLPMGSAVITCGLNTISLRHSLTNSALAVARLVSTYGNDVVRECLRQWYTDQAKEKRWQPNIELTVDGLIPVKEKKGV